MRFQIEPNDRGFIVTCDGWGLGVTFRTYTGAVRAVNAIADEAVNPAGVVVIDYSRCIAAQEAAEVRCESCDAPLVPGTAHNCGELPDEMEPCPRCGTLHDEDYCPTCEEFGDEQNEPHPQPTPTS